MDGIKTAKCIGVMEITIINVSCPHCDHQIQIPYEEFEENAGVPWLGKHEGMPMVCPECGVYFELGEFEVQE